jgi:hypothetical protein
LANEDGLPWVTPQIKKANKQEKQIIQKEKNQTVNILKYTKKLNQNSRKKEFLK